jgi:mRNA-degrading endonuclease RelE of RelBE toxin-antitoxin system
MKDKSRKARDQASSDRPAESTAKPKCEPVFSPDARRQLLKLRAFDQKRLVDAIRQQLVEADPRAQTRNKFALDPGAKTADYELRVGNLRVLYRVEEVEAQLNVIVAIIGRKDRNKLIVEGEEFPL